LITLSNKQLVAVTSKAELSTNYSITSCQYYKLHSTRTKDDCNQMIRSIQAYMYQQMQTNNYLAIHQKNEGTMWKHTCQVSPKPLQFMMHAAWNW